MPSEYDEFSERAYPNYNGGVESARRRRDYLRAAMEREGFQVYEFEWWHFDFKDWQHYPRARRPVLRNRYEQGVLRAGAAYARTRHEPRHRSDPSRRLPEHLPDAARGSGPPRGRQLGIAYLFCRTADTIADTRLLAPEARLRLPAQLPGAVRGRGARPRSCGRDLSREAGAPQRIPAEAELLRRLAECFELHASLREADRSADTAPRHHADARDGDGT
jgi:hypothetical protein